MLDASIKAQLKTYLERLQQPIELVASLDDSSQAQEMRVLLDDIALLSDKVSMRNDGIDKRKPSFAVTRPNTAARIGFAGIPMGHEFTSLVLALLQTGGHPPKIEAELIEQIRAIPGSFHFETFISLSCHNCPDVVQALNLMSVLNPGISHTMIDGALYQDEVNQRKIMAVPTINLNGEPFGQGRMTLEEIIAKIDTGAIAREAGKIAAKDSFDVLIVDGGPAGAIENFISVSETDGPNLAAGLEQHVREYEVDIMNLQRAEALVQGKDGLKEVRLASGAVLKSRSVIISTGARWREMNVPGEKEYRDRGVAYCPHCNGPLFKGKRVAVIGGGQLGR